MVNKRFIKINNCRLCEFAGHSSNGEEYIFICANPDHSDLDLRKIRIGDKFYPVTSQGKRLKDNKIPDWCKLPKEIKE